MSGSRPENPSTRREGPATTHFQSQQPLLRAVARPTDPAGDPEIRTLRSPIRSGVGRQDAPLPALDDDQVGRAVGGDDLEASDTAVTTRVPPTLVERPRTGPADDLLRWPSVDRQCRRLPAQLATAPDDDGVPLFVGDDGRDTVTVSTDDDCRRRCRQGARPRVGAGSVEGADASAKQCRRGR